MRHPLRCSLVLSLALVLGGCGGSGDADTRSTQPGSAGGAGGQGTGGGAAATGGSGAGAGGSAAGAGGSAAGAGGASCGAASPECQQASDCLLHSDCCSCVVLAPGEAAPPCSETNCKASACELIGNPKAACSVGQCTLDRSCDVSKVTCKSLPAACPSGSTQSVDLATSCWGGCVKTAECSEVRSCADCQDSKLTCVQTVAFQTQIHCVATPAACAGCATATCGCLGPAVCLGGFSACVQSTSAISCECPTC